MTPSDLLLCLKAGEPVSDSAWERVWLDADALSAWQDRLQLLQTLPLRPIPPDWADPIEGFVRDNLHDPNLFVRAWALTGLAQLARMKPELTDEVVGLCNEALASDSAAMRARARQVLKGLPHC